MPPGQEWRTGADEATTLKTDKPLKFGTLAVPAGAVTLYTVPGDKEWQLVVSKKTGQWGIPYPKGEDLGRVPMKVAKPDKPVEQLTIAIDDTPLAACSASSGERRAPACRSPSASFLPYQHGGDGTIRLLRYRTTLHQRRLIRRPFSSNR